MKKPIIIYTRTDEAPLLATYSLLPIINFMASSADIQIDLKDISLAARILAKFPNYISNKQFVSDDLDYLRRQIETEHANIIKLPNISASLPQLIDAIKELQQNGYSLPDYPEKISFPEDEKVKLVYDSIKGSAVNPILRQGNSDRRIPKVVKKFSQKYPPYLGKWAKNSKTHISSMSFGDFRNNEKSVTITSSQIVSIQFTSNDGTNKLLKSNVFLQKGEIVDATKMQRQTLKDFISREIENAKEKNILFSLHLKATMMKKADPIIFGTVVELFFNNFFSKYKDILKDVHFNPNNGLSDLFNKIERIPVEYKNEISKELQKCIENGPPLAMVDSDKGITNLHYPNDIIIDASLPAIIKNSGKMWDKNGDLQDTKVVIPDSSYADLYQSVVNYCKNYGNFSPEKMGSVSNVGLMAAKAEEYGSHDKTFEIAEAGLVRIINQKEEVLIEHTVEKGDIWRMCQVKDIAIKNWIELIIERVKDTNNPAVFWLDNTRPHDKEIINKLNIALANYTDQNLDIKILPVKEATEITLKTIHQGKDIIAATGNVLRDYISDLFPIVEVGTSAKMLSIVPLLNGGKLFETGSGGSAPKHVQQFLDKGHLRWDSLGEFLALAYSFEFLGKKYNNNQSLILANTLNQAIEKYLTNKRNPSRNVGELDTRGSHFYLALYWAEALALQALDTKLKSTFVPVFDTLQINEDIILNEINATQGRKFNLQGYYYLNNNVLLDVMRPSKIFKIGRASCRERVCMFV